MILPRNWLGRPPLFWAKRKPLGETQTTGEKSEIITAKDAGAKCSIALGAWESSRADATAIARTLLEAEKKEGSDAKAKATAAQEKADKAEAELKKANADLKALQSVDKSKD